MNNENTDKAQEANTRAGSIFDRVTQRVLNELKAGRLPWRKTWRSGLPKSLATGKEYRGVNILLLAISAHTSRHWVTFRQAQRLGGHVRKGEKSTPVVYWKWRTKEELEQLREKAGKDVAPCVPFVSAVFNLDQVEGIAEPEEERGQFPNEPLKAAEAVFEVMPDKPVIEHSATFEPAYIPGLDAVRLPHLSRFENADEYYSTLFHELVHSTGHPRRLDRFSSAEGERVEKYSFEELVAEFGAAFLCAFAGIRNPDTQALQTSYIEGWAKVFRQDGRILLRAASAAQQAADFIRGKCFVENALSDAA